MSRARVWAAVCLALATACMIETVPLPEDRYPAGDGAGGYNGGGDSDQHAGTSDPVPGEDGDSGEVTEGDSDRDYGDWTGCGTYDESLPETAGAAACLCEGVNGCAAVSGMNALPLGSEQFRVCGVESGHCVIATFSEVEGGGTGSRCRVPVETAVCDEAPLSLEDLAGLCTESFSCNLLQDTCPADRVPCD